MSETTGLGKAAEMAMKLFGSLILQNTAAADTRQLNSDNLEYNSFVLQQTQDFTRENMWIQKDMNDDAMARQNQYNQSLMDYAANVNLQQAQLMPSAQMQGFIDAGINPNAAVGMMGNVSGVSNPSASAPQAASPGSPVPPAPSIFNPAQMELEALKTFSESELNSALARKTSGEADILEVDLQYRPAHNDAELDQIRANVEVALQQGRINEQEADSFMIRLDLYKDKTNAEIRQITKELDVMSETIREKQANIQLLEQQIQSEKHKQSLMSAQELEAYWNSAESKAAIGVADKTMSLRDAEAYLTELKADSQAYDNDVTEWFLQNGVDPKAGPGTQLMQSLMEGLHINQDKIDYLLNYRSNHYKYSTNTGRPRSARYRFFQGGSARHLDQDREGSVGNPSSSFSEREKPHIRMPWQE